jgi:hypothetical protein
MPEHIDAPPMEKENALLTQKLQAMEHYLLNMTLT